MARESWLSPDDTGPESAPGFLAGPKVGPKLNYVYGPGRKGAGYYHILTKQAYQILHNRLQTQAPEVTCCGIGTQTPEYDAWETTVRIVYNRCVASKPNDVLAAKNAIAIAQQTASACQPQA